MPHCQVCHKFQETKELLIKHLKEYHPNNKQMGIPCGVGDCTLVFNCLTTRTSHISRKHSDSSKKSSSKTICKNLVDTNDIQQDVPQCTVSKKTLQRSSDATTSISNTIESMSNLKIDDHDLGVVESKVIRSYLCDLKDEKQQTELKFILGLRAKNLSEVTIKNIMTNSKSIVQLSLKECLEDIKLELQKHGIDLSNYIDANDKIDKYSNLFSTIRTKHKQNKYLKSSESYVTTHRMKLDSQFKKGKQANFGENRAIVLQSDEVIYISIIELMIKLLENPQYKKLLNFSPPQKADILKSFTNGQSALQNDLFCKNPNSLQILLYNDDVNLNDTASARPIKMSMFYISVANMENSYRSSLKFINLVLAIESEVIDFHPLEEILSPLVNDLKKLENGVRMPDDSVLYGTLAAFLGDNLASHKIGGFKQGFTAKHPCRYCMATLDQVRVMVREDITILRTADQYDMQVKNLNKCKTKQERKKLSKEYGLNSECPFNYLKYFFAVSGFPPDIFHDIFEGAILRAIWLILIRFLRSENKVMTLQEFNDKLTEFDFGYSETKPSIILECHLNEDGKLHQTGSQIWSLAVITPLILGPFIAHDDPYWQNYILLLEITMLICSYEISLTMVAFLQEEIEFYLWSFLKLYKLHLIPKQHFMIHYPRLSLLFGPLYNFITFRMEAKHQFFKDMMRKIKNMKNPAKTMSEQHQLYQWHVSESFTTSYEYGKLELCACNNLSFSDILPQDCKFVYRMSWLKISGVEIKPEKCFVMVDYVENHPKFSLVLAVLYYKENYVLVTQTATTITYDTHLNAYQIRLEQKKEIKNINELFVLAVYHPHNVKGRTFIITKRAAGDIF